MVQKQALLISYDFPPSNRVAVQRSLAMAYHLMQIGWDIKILTVGPKCYESIDKNLFTSLELEQATTHAWAFNTRKIGFRGKYIDLFTIPDEWISWLIPALIKGRQLIKANKFDCIWSTCPPFTTEFIAGLLSKRYNIPWVADYRDPVLKGDHGKGVIGQAWGIDKVDAFTIKHASKVVFTTTEALDLYKRYYPNTDHKKFSVIQNGYYDLPNIDRAQLKTEYSARLTKHILYSGSIYGARNPSLILEALALLKQEGRIAAGDIKLQFQGEGLNSTVAPLIGEFALEGFVDVLPSVGFEESIKNMYQADALLLIQGEKFNLHIPAKAYEYIASKRPIISFCPAGGATAVLLKDIPNALAVDSLETVTAALIMVLNDAFDIPNHEVAPYARKSRALELDTLFTGLSR